MDIAQKLDISNGKSDSLIWLSPMIIQEFFTDKSKLTLGTLRQSMLLLWREPDELYLN